MRNLDLTIYDNETLTEATMQFHHAYEDGDYESASNLAHFFNIKEGRVQKALLNHWKSLIENVKYIEALSLKKARKIPKKILDPLAEEFYDLFMSQSKTELAVKFRKDYKLKISIIKWITEHIRNLFG